ncbi:nucleotide-binding universal stress UspA family protein [Micromonospora pisi]|uniref:Nucleotide-binding universal stress UspA family protein n=2 Tax=Micromonospora pisi TaxID=589240 RepID=A0A495JQN9_9ACTN|nr:nucleotide-binding universal stress UspA family protein [Micromonospora pisi]
MRTMSLTADAPVVVGVDDSPQSLTAVRLAAHEAAAHQRPLRIVHAFNWIADPSAPIEGELREPAERILNQAAQVATESEPVLRLTCALIEGPALTTLLRESGSAALLVLGDGGLSGQTAVPIEAISVQIAARAGCSVLVARENLPPPAPVLVGIDCGAGTSTALDFAFDAAATRDSELVVLRVWEADDPSEEPDPSIARQLAETVAPWQERYPAVRVTQQVRSGESKHLLIEASRTAELVVVSMRGEQPSRSMLGALSQTLLYHSPAPVVIVRTAHELYIQA